MKVAVIGGGAAGFFSAFACKEKFPVAEVTIFEKSSKLLAKVKVSGGGRCNVTHACFEPAALSKFYPRGAKQLRKAFHTFNTNHTVAWFENRGVALKTEADNRMFPATNTSQTIIDCFFEQARILGIEIRTNTGIKQLNKEGAAFKLHTANESILVDKVIVATGGSPKLAGFNWLADLGHEIAPPVPSLFTFNMPHESITSLMGVVANPATVKIQGTKLKSTGPLLITHWGMSGPAILKLSAFGARELSEMNYRCTAQINWLGEVNEDELRARLNARLDELSRKKIANKNPFELPNRLWLFLLEKLDISADLTWEQLGKKNRNRLINCLLNDTYDVEGKTTFKEEFVTCGGVSLGAVSMKNMESRSCPGLHFAGEVLNIDGVTGGFNFQAAWTTGYLAGTGLQDATEVSS